MNTTNRIFAFCSYLLLIPGWLLVLIFRRKHPSELQHARQSLLINLAAFLLLVIWFLLAWLLFSIPIMGPLLAWFTFALVIAAWVYCIAIWITGMVRALFGSQKPMAIVGDWAQKMPF